MRQLNPDNTAPRQRLLDMVIACAEMYSELSLEGEYTANVIFHSVRGAADRTGLDVDDNEILDMIHQHTEIERC